MSKELAFVPRCQCQLAMQDSALHVHREEYELNLSSNYSLFRPVEDDLLALPLVVGEDVLEL